jgi:endonuclease YncB( thermonuclease family)
MTRDDIIRLAREAGWNGIYSKPLMSIRMQEENFLRFAALVAAAEREKVAKWMIKKGYATGHGDTIEGLLKALEWQAKERARGFL